MANLAPRRPRALLITPIAPAPTGNGLAMRAALAVEGLTRCCDLWTAVVPVSDPGVDQNRMRWVDERCARSVIVEPEQPADAVIGWLGIPAAREVVSSAQPLPDKARRASPESGIAAKKQLGCENFDLIWVLRLYLAGTAASFIESSPRPRLILDSDDDDEMTLRSIAALHVLRGDDAALKKAENEAAAYGRLAAGCLPWFDQVFAASPVDADTLAKRHGLDNVATLPNAVNTASGAVYSPVKEPNIVFVGNLDYLPNLDAVVRLATRVMPAIRRDLPKARLQVAGAGGGSAVAQLKNEPGVTVHGPLEDLKDLYSTVSLAVVPLRAGGGSRLKILEAFANMIPVVATHEAAKGLDVTDGRELVLEVSDEDLASAALEILREPGLAADLAANARRYVTEHHELNAIARNLAGRITGLIKT